MKKCLDCNTKIDGRALRCTECANLHKAQVANFKADLREKSTKKRKYLKLKNGLEVLNNCFGQTMYSPDTVWNSKRAI